MHTPAHDTVRSTTRPSRIAKSNLRIHALALALIKHTINLVCLKVRAASPEPRHANHALTWTLELTADSDCCIWAAGLCTATGRGGRAATPNTLEELAQGRSTRTDRVRPAIWDVETAAMASGAQKCCCPVCRCVRQTRTTAESDGPKADQTHKMRFALRHSL